MDRAVFGEPDSGAHENEIDAAGFDHLPVDVVALVGGDIDARHRNGAFESVRVGVAFVCETDVRAIGGAADIFEADHGDEDNKKADDVYNGLMVFLLL